MLSIGSIIPLKGGGNMMSLSVEMHTGFFNTDTLLIM